MSRYSKMNAPPFWMWMFRVAGMACLVTLLTPTAYLLKYSFLDHPTEAHIAAEASQLARHLGEPAFANGTELYIRTAEGGGASADRIVAVERLGTLAASKRTQMARPVECLHAKLALEEVAVEDPDAAVRSIAKSTLMTVASNGAVIQR